MKTVREIDSSALRAPLPTLLASSNGACNLEAVSEEKESGCMSTLNEQMKYERHLSEGIGIHLPLVAHRSLCSIDTAGLTQMVGFHRMRCHVRR
jgi:hypothetical protein